jgi:HAD superfamily hydrolase (TIGR01509 family)
MQGPRGTQQAALDRVRRRGILAVLFDMDGVLVDSVEAHMQAWNETLRQNDLPLMDLSAYLNYTGKTNRSILANHLRDLQLDLPDSNKRELIHRKESLLRVAMRGGARTTPGVIQWLEFLKTRGIRCAVASSAEMANIVTVVETLGLGNFFTALVSGSSLPASKPDPQVFLLAAAAVGVSPDKCLVVEDAPAGLQAAAGAGMLCCAVSTTTPATALHQADLLLENLAQLDPAALFVS